MEEAYEHFMSLTSHDRFLRFGGYISPEGIRQYLSGIRETDKMITIQEDGVIIGLAHLAITGTVAEVGLSVLPTHRCQGFGSRLFAETVAWCQEHGIQTLTTQCLATNSWMIGKARKEGMDIEICGPERFARKELTIPDECVN